MESTQIAWHPAFIEAIQLELEDYSEVLEFFPEYQLTSEPLRIDCVVIKKPKNVIIKKNIAAIFGEVNLLEYKSPADHVSVMNFYKVYAYACLYASFEKVPISNLTITFVESRYPKKLISHLEKICGYTIEKTGEGIYTVKGDIIAMQIIDNRKLSAEENLWLKNLSNKLDPAAIRQLSDKLLIQGKIARIEAYINAITKANYRAIEEAIDMSDAAKSLEDVLIRTGLAARWEARFLAKGEAIGETRGETRGRESQALAIAQNMVSDGFLPEKVASMTGLDIEKVKELYQADSCKLSGSK